MQKTSLLLFTRAEFGGRYVFRALGAELCVSAGEGRLWIDVSRQNRVDVSWQQCLLNLSHLGRTHYDLPWDRTDLHVSFRGAGLSLAGASASLPLFVGWIALLRSTLGGRALPDPFFAAGVAATGSDALAPAPREYVQGKLEIADALARKRGGAARPAMWVPEGSDFDAGSLQAIDVRQTPSLRDAVLRILGAEARP
jgi:hypothetical protein